MSIDHKAWLFDHDAFEAELADILYGALEDRDVGPLRDFINRHRQQLTDLETLEPPGEDWEGRLGGDVQAYADLALTKYHDPDDSVGVGHRFDALHAYLRTVKGLAKYADALIGGYPFGPEGNRLDPGRMGTGLLSARQVKQMLARLEKARFPPVPEPDSEVFAHCYYKPEHPEEVKESLESLREVYRLAAAEWRGLLLADFHD